MPINNNPTFEQVVDTDISNDYFIKELFDEIKKFKKDGEELTEESIEESIEDLKNDIIIKVLSEIPSIKDSYKEENFLIEKKGGIRYTGAMQNGKPDGLGLMQYGNGRGVFMGQWKQGVLSGFGAAFFENGNMVCGDFEENKIHGEAEYYDHSGHKYKGEFEEGHFRKGALTKPDGTKEIYARSSVDNKYKKNGLALEIDNYGKVTEAYYDKGEKIELSQLGYEQKENFTKMRKDPLFAKYLGEEKYLVV